MAPTGTAQATSLLNLMPPKPFGRLLDAFLRSGTGVPRNARDAGKIPAVDRL